METYPKDRCYLTGHLAAILVDNHFVQATHTKARKGTAANEHSARKHLVVDDDMTTLREDGYRPRGPVAVGSVRHEPRFAKRSEPVSYVKPLKRRWTALGISRIFHPG
jgi:hypothetical protein